MDRKIKQLFKYREIPFLLRFVEGNKRIILENQLFKIQEEIYMLDQYLENQWELDPEKSEELNRGVVESIETLGYSREKAESMMSDIHQYEHHESLLRKGTLPDFSELLNYYYYKSCDVRLARSIIFDHSELLQADHKIEDWRLFDLVAEINDDIRDLEEDMETINGNAFLISLVEQGEKPSIDQFQILLERMLIDSKALLDSNNESKTLEYIHENTVEQVEATRMLMIEQIESWNKRLKHITPKLYMYLKKK